MQQLFLGIAVLACPVGMGLMMWLMGRGQRKDSGGNKSESRQQVEQLRAEIDQLKADRAASRTVGGQ